MLVLLLSLELTFMHLKYETLASIFRIIHPTSKMEVILRRCHVKMAQNRGL